MTKNQYTTYYELSDGIYFNIVSFGPDEIVTEIDEYKNRFFTEVSKYICFSDCGGYTVTRIVFMGEAVEYTGWQPNNVVEYQNRKGETVWEGQFPEWEH